MDRQLTLITSVLDGEPYVAELFDSIQHAPQIEHVVIDAGSRDGTLERLREKPSIRLFERPRIPLYEAWNLGLDQAEGRFVWFLNADDVLPEGAVEAVLSVLSHDPEADILRGRAETIRDDVSRSAGNRQRYPEPGGVLEPLDLMFGSPAINAMVIRRRLFDRIGPFDTAYKFAADRAWLLRAALEETGRNCQPIHATIYRYRIHAGSMTLSQGRTRRVEIADEHLRIAETLLAGEHSMEIRSMAKAWRARESAVAALSAGAPGRIVRFLRRLPGSVPALLRARRYRRRAVGPDR